MGIRPKHEMNLLQTKALAADSYPRNYWPGWPDHIEGLTE